MNEIILDEHVLLRRIAVTDAPAMFRLIDSQREYLGEWLPFIPFTVSVEDSMAFLESVCSLPDEKCEYVFAIIVDGNFAGTIGIKDTDLANCRTEIGYWLGEQYQGRGIVTRAVEALCLMAYNELGINRIQIKCAVGNHKSSNIPKRLGFRFEGTERAGERKADGSFFDIEIYSKLKSD